MKKSLACKIELWNNMTAIMSQIENRNSGTLSLASVIGVIISAVSLIYGENKGNVQDVLNVSYVIMPFFIVVCLVSFSFDNRSAAIIKGYLAGIEDSINMELGKCIYQFNSYYPWFYSRKYFMTNHCIALVYIPVVVILSILCFYKIFILQIIPLILGIPYFIVYLGIVVVTIRELATNARIRKMARAHFHELEALSSVNYKKMNLKDFLDYKIDLDAILLKYKINND